MGDVLLVEAIPAADASSAPSEAVRSHERMLTSFNPATGEPVGYVPLVGREGVDAAVTAAREAQTDWGALSVTERTRYLHRLRLQIVEEAEELARLISTEQGKPRADALSIEVLPAATLLKYLEREARTLLAPRRVVPRQPMFASKRNNYRYEPLGVIAVISPWNYPFGIPFQQVAAALVAGNTVVLKPSPFTPLIGQKIAELGRLAGLPAGVLQVLHLDDADAPALVSHPAVDKIIFTGSTATGRKVMAAAAVHPTPVILELGGKDPALVCADADLDRAVPGIVWYAMANSGQTCASIETVYLERPIAEAFIRRAVAEVQRLRVGNPLDPDVEIGPLTNERQLQIVEEHVADAVAKGAEVLVGGRRRPGPGYFFEPTVLTRVDRSMRIMNEETFGPVLPIVVCDSMEEAVQLANESLYGLTASIWTSNLDRAQALAQRIRAGAVNINDHACNWAEPSASWGGVGHSGFGRTHGEFGLVEMVNIKWISADIRPGELEAWWYPYNEGTLHLLRNAVRFLFGATERRPYALASLLLNPRTYQRVNLVRLAMNFRQWL
ncbi:MAG: aldehyde dehydrogenase family protein [Ardenticatenaceae bacterium]|nr:aldehyde dehydrogenase family protein [Ardenticatenaceae bacterium]HBY98036.1 succinate-semialdehyde dehydrogenase [Chloroflexota bacterium]